MAVPSRVGVLFGGPSPEHDVSILTGLAALHALFHSDVVHEARGLYWSKTGSFHEVDPALEAIHFAEGVPRSANSLELRLGPDGGFYPARSGLKRSVRLSLEAILVCCHGGPGEDGSLQGTLDLAGLSYSGPSPITAALGMDKLATAALLEQAGLSVLPRVLLEDDLEELAFLGPYIVKPRFGGSSIGIDLVADLPTARARLKANQHLRRGAVIEPYRADLSDLQIAVRSWPDLLLSEVERPLRPTPSTEILGYADKYVSGAGMHAASRELPANIPSTLRFELRDAAVHVAHALGLRGVCRVDFLSDGSQFFVNEVNTIPGSLSRHLFIDPPLPFEELLADLLQEAVSQPTAAFSSLGADGALLREATNIAGKLA